MNLQKLTVAHTAFTPFTSGEVCDDEAAVPTGGQNLQRPKRTIRNTLVCTAEGNCKSFNFLYKKEIKTNNQTDWSGLTLTTLAQTPQ